MSARVHQFLCLQDNFGVLVHDSATGATASIDAPDAAPILKALADHGWTLTDILVTHRHADHVQGIPDLKKQFPQARVVAPAGEADRVPMVDLKVAEGDYVSVGKLTAKVIETPGHTLGHIAYWFHDDKLAFVGDTLFSIGCGRVIEGDPEMMWASLKKLRDLPNDTDIFCGHEYTAANIKFALTVEPDNEALKVRAEQVTRLRADGKPTIPTLLGEEKKANIFLRADEPSVAAGVRMKGRPPAEVFGELRERKNKS